MKRLLLFTLALTFTIGTSFGQDVNKELRNATKALGTYNLDPTNNKAKLTEAKSAIDATMEMSEAQSLADAWIAKGDIYNEIASQIVTTRQLGFGNLEDLPKTDNAAHSAYLAYMKAWGMIEKKYQEKDIINGVAATMNTLSNLGIYQYEDQEFDKAYNCFNAMLEGHKFLLEQGEASPLGDEAAVNQQKYITGLAALSANMLKEAKMVLTELYEMNYDKPAIYESLYQIESRETSPEEAFKYLKKGRELYPDDISILFAEINHYLKLGKMQELLEDLDKAIEKEPNNVSLYSVKGNVYDNLYQKANEAGDAEKAQEYFNGALKFYGTALEKDSMFVNAIYSIGALYYNKAAQLTQQMQALSDDYSKEGMKKYDELQQQVESQFNLALPYFQRAEKLDPNDINTLIALKEIYARRDELEISNEFKTRLENVQNGGTNDSSYFK